MKTIAFYSPCFCLSNRVWHGQIISCTVVTYPNYFKCLGTIFAIFWLQKTRYFLERTHQILTPSNVSAARCRLLDWFWLILVIRLPTSFRVASLALGQCDCPSASELTLKDMDKIDHYLTDTVETLYNTINFCWSTHKRHSIARPKGRGMGCLLWVQRATYCVDLSILSSINYFL